jgi:hypothetical protein
VQGVFAVFERASRSRVVSALIGLVLTELAPSEPSWPVSRAAATPARASMFAGARARAGAPIVTAEDDLVQKQPLCVASSVRSAGSLGETVLYRFRRDGDTLYVGYFVYFSTERPWGDNALTHNVLPALAIDAFYSHFLFVLPGVQRVLYGPADIEGALVRYRIEGERLVPEAAVADDEGHHPVRLAQDELGAPDGRVVLLTETWSHQLGAHDAVRRAREVTCFDGARLAPLTEAVAQAFRLGTESAPRRAKPAWRSNVE